MTDQGSISLICLLEAFTRTDLKSVKIQSSHQHIPPELIMIREQVLTKNDAEIGFSSQVTYSSCQNSPDRMLLISFSSGKDFDKTLILKRQKWENFFSFILRNIGF